jgi:hypothetical protein
MPPRKICSLVRPVKDSKHVNYRVQTGVYRTDRSLNWDQGERAPLAYPARATLVIGDRWTQVWLWPSHTSPGHTHPYKQIQLCGPFHQVSLCLRLCSFFHFLFPLWHLSICASPPTQRRGGNLTLQLSDWLVHHPWDAVTVHTIPYNSDTFTCSSHSLQNQHLSANIHLTIQKAFIRSVMSYACPCLWVCGRRLSFRISAPAT